MVLGSVQLNMLTAQFLPAAELFRSTGAFIRCLHEILVEEVWYIYKFVPTKCNIWCPRSHFLVLPYINGILEGRCILILSRQSERFGAPAPTSWFISLFWEEDRCILLLSQRSVKLGTPVPTLWFTCLLSTFWCPRSLLHRLKHKGDGFLGGLTRIILGIM